MPCRHCGKKKVNRPLGLCHSCHATPGVRERYIGEDRLTDLWRDVTCPECRKRLAERDHPTEAYAVGGFARVTEGHSLFEVFRLGGVVALCKAGPRKQGSAA